MESQKPRRSGRLRPTGKVNSEGLGTTSVSSPEQSTGVNVASTPPGSLYFHNVVRDNEIYSPRELAEALHISTGTVSRAIRTGKLPAARIGGQWRISGSDFLLYLTTQTSLALSKSSAGAAANR